MLGKSKAPRATVYPRVWFNHHKETHLIPNPRHHLMRLSIITVELKTTSSPSIFFTSRASRSMWGELANILNKSPSHSHQSAELLQIRHNSIISMVLLFFLEGLYCCFSISFTFLSIRICISFYIFYISEWLC